MATDRDRIFIAILIFHYAHCDASSAENINVDQTSDINAEARALFSPRVDYNEWMPVGRGDPLKNDPTYDYSPPALDRVQYWGNTNKSKEKKDVLVLGVTSKRSYKKEPKHNPIMRRNFVSHLPTRLMPPPMQTISPSKKYPTTDNYHSPYYRNHYNAPSQSWSSNGMSYADSNVQESINYVNVKRPHKNSIRNEYSTHHMSSASRKPWLHALLEKEVTKPTPLYVMQPSKSIFESHPPPSFETTPFIQATTTTMASPVMISTTRQPAYFQPTIPPEIITTTTEKPHALLSQPQNMIPYLIIEGHSKVKTYGQNDNATRIQHAPKIVTIKADDESIVQHVVSEDEKGEPMEVMHLHQKTMADLTTTTAEPPSAMGDLLSLLDTSLGNFFLGEEHLGSKLKAEHKSTKPNLETTENSGSVDTVIDAENDAKKANSQMIPTPGISERSDNVERETRQIFDYDNLPEPSFSAREDVNGEDFHITLLPKHAQADVYDTEADYSSTEAM